MSTYYVYVTSLIDSRWERRTGIPRVEYEIARDALLRGGRLIMFSKLVGAFVEIEHESVRDLVELQDRDLGEVLDAEHGPAGRTARAAARVLPLIARKAGNPAGAKLFAMATPALHPIERRRIADDMGLFGNATASIRYLQAMSRKRRTGSWPWRKLKRVEFKSGDAIVIPGIVWAPQPLRALARLQRTRGVLIAPFIHDLIPIRHPEYYTNSVGIARYRRFIDAILGCSAAALANSRFVADDVASYMREHGLGEIPMYPVPLCANLSRGTEPSETPRLSALGLQRDHYVLFVSTFSPRKNQAGAYRLWRRLFEIMGHALPPLVLAGQRGWRSQGVFAEIMADESMWGRHIHYVEAPTDAELAQLYRGCCFTIFPSLYEGWGLPITESLEFGKPCIAGDNTSLPEAGQGLALHVDAASTEAWVPVALRLIQDAKYREDITGRIASHYHHRTWAQVGEEIHTVVRGMGSHTGERGLGPEATLDSAAVVPETGIAG